MEEYSNKLIDQYIEKKINVLFQKQYDILIDIKLEDLLYNQNPYTLATGKSKSAGSIVKEMIDDAIDSKNDCVFINWLKGLALYINQNVYSGRKSGIKGIDLEFDKEEVRCIVSIKSGPNWGNSSQIKKMESDFITAQKTLRTSNSHLQIMCVNGCCYGKNNHPDKGFYYKYCGQMFREFIGGNKNMYTDIIEPLGYKAKERNEDYFEEYAQLINRFTKEFIELFCDNNGKIDWNKLVRFNSGHI